MDEALRSPSMTQLPQPLPANQAFVVQIRSQPTADPVRCEGRIEHLASGQATRFGSQAELWMFIIGILIEPMIPRPEGTLGGALGTIFLLVPILLIALMILPSGQRISDEEE